ncbi:serine hydrolase [Spirosoma foliorum]|uniref:Serine hydrolase n=1 Tax=Spirosoma foliorum TaxID=2710596 RepID=A0A7G5H1H5_9BACT|nr:serine hydrolase [Spirosoma foliorum]QMW04967.1 serine hydrolase [Spirosoma foliorum]
MRIQVAWLCITLLVSTTFIDSQALAQSRKDSINVFIKKQMQNGHIPGLQLAIIRNGHIDQLSAYGLANVEYQIRTTDQNVFAINSMTKAFVGVAIMQLAEQEKLRINDPIGNYIDSLPTAWQSLTIQQLLTNTSGLPNIIDQYEHVLGQGQEQAAWTEVKALPIEFKPGERFSYNQTGYVILGKIINRLSGVAFTQFIEDNQFKVAGMNLTRFGDSSDLIPNSAGGYTRVKNVNGKWLSRDEKDPLGVDFIKFPVFFRTATGILSTAQDMAHWLIALQSGKLLKKKESLEALWTPARLTNGQVSGFNELTNGYALGWPTVTRDEHPAVAPVGGFRSALFVYPKDDLSIVVLTNLQGANPEWFIDEIAGYYLPDMHKANGFGLSSSLKTLRTELLKKGFTNAIPIAKTLQQKNASFHLKEDQLNSWAYYLASENKTQEALAIFKLTVALYPQSANAYDSLGEGYDMVGDKASAIQNYKRSLELDATNQNAANQIARLSKTP